MRVVVAGAGGFIGAHLVRFLIGQAHEVVPAHWPFSWPTLLADRPDWVLWAAGPARSIEQLNLAQVGDAVAGFGALCEAALKGDTKILFLSSAAVYGPQEHQPVPETAGLRPPTAYAAIQAGREAVAVAFHNFTGRPAPILRLGTVYGPGMREDALIQGFLDAARVGQPLEVRRDRGRLRPFLHVDDLLAFIHRILLKGRGGTYNVAADHVTVEDLAKLILRARVWPDGARIAYIDPPLWESGSTVLDCSRALRTDWRPRISLSRGLARLVEEGRE